MDMEDANKYEIDSLIKTKEIKDYTLHSWGFLFVLILIPRKVFEKKVHQHLIRNINPIRTKQKENSAYRFGYTKAISYYLFIYNQNKIISI